MDEPGCFFSLELEWEFVQPLYERRWACRRVDEWRRLRSGGGESFESNLTIAGAEVLLVFCGTTMVCGSCAVVRHLDIANETAAQLKSWDDNVRTARDAT